MQRLSKLAIGAGVVALVGAVLWSLVAVPLLVRLPKSVDSTYTYRGTFSTATDLATGQPLPGGTQQIPMTITRHVQTVPRLTTRQTEVLDEHVATTIGTRFTTEQHRYTIDRKSMRLRGGSNSWSYDASNTVDRSGAYRISFPVGTKLARTYRVWSNELGAPVDAKTATKYTKLRGLKVVTISSSGAGAASPAYTAGLKARGIPSTVSIAQIKSQLAILGFDAEQLVNDVTAAAGPSAGAAVQAGLNSALPVHFTVQVRNTNADIEPQTGQVVRNHTEQAIAAQVDATAIAALKTSMQPLASIASVQRTMQILDVVAAAPPNPVVSWSFDETPASVASAVSNAKTHLRQLRIVRNGIPTGLAVLGFVLGLLGVYGIVRRREDTDPDDTITDVRDAASSQAETSALDIRPEKATTKT